jgi:hypothetical protein
MAIANPIEIPTGLVFNRKTFQLGHKQQISPGGAGFIQTIDRMTPTWFAEYSSPPLKPARYDQAIEFFLKLEGSMETFLAYDPRRIMPRAYSDLPVSSDPWTLIGQVAPRVTTYNFANSTISLDRLENGAVITAGDYISFLIGNIWYLFRAQTTVVAAGNAAVVTVKPRPALVGTLPVNIRYRRACAQMKIIGGVREDDSMDSHPSFSFKAYQFINRT